jgi:hypothetical protein
MNRSSATASSRPSVRGRPKIRARIARGLLANPPSGSSPTLGNSLTRQRAFAIPSSLRCEAAKHLKDKVSVRKRHRARMAGSVLAASAELPTVNRPQPNRKSAQMRSRSSVTMLPPVVSPPAAMPAGHRTGSVLAESAGLPTVNRPRRNPKSAQMRSRSSVTMFPPVARPPAAMLVAHRAGSVSRTLAGAKQLHRAAIVRGPTATARRWT